jgi:ATP-binding cassette subfamily G (WHITE) protein 2
MEPGKFFLFFLTVFLTTICASAVAFTVSATVGVFAIANLFCVLIFILNLIFGGLLVNIRNLGDWIRWLQYLSIIRYSLNTLTINELKSLEFSGRLGCASCNGTVLGSDFLDAQGIKHETGWDLWQNIMALGLMAIGIMCLAYIQLRRMKKLK